MKPESESLDDLVEFILAAAARDDDWTRRALSRIHILKYVYLADLLQAEAGEAPLTSASWVFHNFGPWDPSLMRSIESSLDRIGAECLRRESQYRDDWQTWKWNSDLRPFDQLRRQMPIRVRLGLPREIHKYANSTEALLDRVYKTWPMLNAAPGERLVLEDPETRQAAPEDEPPTQLSDTTAEHPSHRTKKKLKAAKLELQERLAAWRENRVEMRERLRVAPAPEHGDTYLRVTNWLNSMDGLPIADAAGMVEVDDSVWHSLARLESGSG